MEGCPSSPAKNKDELVRLWTRKSLHRPTWKYSMTEEGKESLLALETTSSSVRLFCTMNCAKSPTTLELGVTYDYEKHWKGRKGVKILDGDVGSGEK